MERIKHRVWLHLYLIVERRVFVLQTEYKDGSLGVMLD